MLTILRGYGKSWVVFTRQIGMVTTLLSATVEYGLPARFIVAILIVQSSY